jgi:hypothetical protein
MFFIAGLTSRMKSIDSGQFFCPNEQGTRHYQHLQQRRWFTLFFIPLIPLGQAGEWLQCQSCGATYDPGILQQWRGSVT